MKPIMISWSGGKDSCLALNALLQAGEYEVAGLLTTITRDYDRISMHGVRRELLHRQAEALGLPLHEVFIPTICSNADYAALMGDAFSAFRQRGIDTIAFGDLFLEDIRDYRDQLAAANGLTATYPVWGRDTAAFVRDFIARGFKAVIVCVDLTVLDASFAGRMLDETFLGDLPAGVDPCGERGEFHTFVFDGPLFARPVPFAVGERVTRGTLSFCELEPQSLRSANSPAEGTERQAC